MDPLLPLPENIIRVAATDTGRKPVLIVRGISDAATTLLDVSWTQLFIDVRRHSEELLRSTNLQRRDPCSPLIIVGLLAQSGYGYLVYLLSMFFLRWTVSKVPSYFVDKFYLRYRDRFYQYHRETLMRVSFTWWSPIKVATCSLMEQLGPLSVASFTPNFPLTYSQAPLWAMT